MNTDLDLEIVELVGELPAIPCEQPEHSSGGPNHGGDATHYIRLLHSCVMTQGAVVAVCDPLTTFLREHINKPAHCNICKLAGNWSDFVRIIGPIGNMP